MRLTLFSTLSVLLVLTTLLSACAGQPAAPASQPTVVPLQDTDTPPAPTATLAQTETARPSLTPAVPPSATPTQVPTATILPTADPALASIKLIGLAWYKDYDLLLSFQFPSAVDPKKYRVTLEDKEYNCEVLAQFPNRLYCKGQGAKVLTTANVRVYQAGSDTPGYEKNVWVPFFPK